MHQHFADGVVINSHLSLSAQVATICPIVATTSYTISDHSSDLGLGFVKKLHSNIRPRKCSNIRIIFERGMEEIDF